MSQSTINDLLDALDREERGNPVLPHGRVRETSVEEPEAAPDLFDPNPRAEELARHRAALEAALTNDGIPLKTVDAEAMALATQLMVDHGLGPFDALERASYMLDNKD